MNCDGDLVVPMIPASWSSHPCRTPFISMRAGPVICFLLIEYDNADGWHSPDYITLYKSPSY